jgi:hypothetical protein
VLLLQGRSVVRVIFFFYYSFLPIRGLSCILPVLCHSALFIEIELLKKKNWVFSFS